MPGGPQECEAVRGERCEGRGEMIVRLGRSSGASVDLLGDARRGARWWGRGSLQSRVLAHPLSA